MTPPTWWFDEKALVAVDISSAMLDRLTRRTRESGRENVEVVEAGFLTYEHVGGPADFVYSRHALHHLPDFWKAVAPAARGRAPSPGRRVLPARPGLSVRSRRYRRCALEPS